MQQPPQQIPFTPASDWNFSRPLKAYPLPSEPRAEFRRVEAGEVKVGANLSQYAKTSPDRGEVAGICLILALLVIAVFGQTVGHPFVNYDDQNYVYENPKIISGLTIDGIGYAFTHRHAQNWHPLTTLSHMLDCQLFGLNPAGHHLINVLLHAIAAMALFVVLNLLSRARWRSAMVAAVFAIHPLRVESVAWIAERKDVLSGVFFMLTLGTYVFYVRSRGWRRYAMVVAAFALSLMAKPTVIMLPVLLFLIDYWPLRRFSPVLTTRRPNGRMSVFDQVVRFSRSPIFLEKIPLFILSMTVGVITLFAQRHTVGYSESIPVMSRVSNAFVAVVTYVWQMFWPARLAVFYPNWGDRESIAVAVTAALLIAAITAVVVCLRRRAPYLFVGWLWYLVALLPVIGLVQVGLQGRADRYTYLPQIGLYIAVIWALGDLFVARVHRRMLTIAAVAGISLLAWRASVQAAFWRDTETLWAHALKVTQSNDVAHYNVAGLLMTRGQYDDAIQHYQAALRASADHESRTHLSPGIVQNALGNAFAKKNDLDTAIVHYQRAIELRPDLSDARVNLSAMLLREGKLADAIAEYATVVSTPPEDGATHERLADMLVKAGRFPDAIAHYRRALELTPESVNALNGLSWLLATNSDRAGGSIDEGLRIAERANKLTHGNDPVVLRILAANYAVAGRPRDAVTAAERALSLAGANTALIRAVTEELESYRTQTSH